MCNTVSVNAMLGSNPVTHACEQVLYQVSYLKAYLIENIIMTYLSPSCVSNTIAKLDN